MQSLSTLRSMLQGFMEHGNFCGFIFWAMIATLLECEKAKSYIIRMLQNLESTTTCLKTYVKLTKCVSGVIY